jgi:hypothetical protein
MNGAEDSTSQAIFEVSACVHVGRQHYCACVAGKTARTYVDGRTTTLSDAKSEVTIVPARGYRTDEARLLCSVAQNGSPGYTTETDKVQLAERSVPSKRDF